jgi:hypothetical protein
MNKTYSVTAVNTNLEAVAKATFAKPDARESYTAAMDYVEYLVNHGFNAVVSCDGDELDRYAAKFLTPGDASKVEETPELV